MDYDPPALDAAEAIPLRVVGKEVLVGMTNGLAIGAGVGLAAAICIPAARVWAQAVLLVVNDSTSLSADESAQNGDTSSRP